MAKKKNYIDSEELKNEILKCITEGYELAVKNGFEYHPLNDIKNELDEIMESNFSDIDEIETTINCMMCILDKNLELLSDEDKDLFKGYINNLKNEMLDNVDNVYGDIKKNIDDVIDEIYKSIDFISTKFYYCTDLQNEDSYKSAIEQGYVFGRSGWIEKLRNYDSEYIENLVDNGCMSRDEANILSKQMMRPIVSDKLGKMFQLIVNNIARSFYWSNPDDGLDCRANALLDLCSNFWKFEPVNPENGKPYNAFAFCSQIAYFGIAGAHRILHPKKYEGTISMSCLDENGKTFDLYNI